MQASAARPKRPPYTVVGERSGGRNVLRAQRPSITLMSLTAVPSLLTSRLSLAAAFCGLSREFTELRSELPSGMGFLFSEIRGRRVSSRDIASGTRLSLQKGALRSRSAMPY